mgnify:CR=1 FL=1
MKKIQENKSWHVICFIYKYQPETGKKGYKQQ